MPESVEFVWGFEEKRKWKYGRERVAMRVCVNEIP